MQFHQRSVRRIRLCLPEALKKEYGFHVTGVGLQTDEMVYEMNEDGSNPADDGKLLYRTVVNLDCDCDYAQLKNCLRGLKKNNFKMSVDTASFGPDEENRETERKHDGKYVLSLRK